MKTQLHSDFWLDGQRLKSGADPITLATHRRAISNFITILTGRADINVRYRVKGESYTDGKCVTISSTLEGKDYDVAVGLALHEGSHIDLSDFDMLLNLSRLIPNTVYRKAANKGIDRSMVLNQVKTLWNYVEDRYIDNHVYKNAPGYRGYYRALYDKYFNDKKVAKGLKSEQFREENWKNYEFRIINLTNPGTDLRALNGLFKIAKIINFKKIDRLRNPIDRLDVAFKIYDIILNNIGQKTSTKKTKEDYSFMPQQSSDGENGDSWPTKYREFDGDESDDESTEADADTSDGDADSDSDGDDLFGGISTEIQKEEYAERSTDEEESTNEKSSLSKKITEYIEEFMDELEAFTNGNHDDIKTEISKELANDVATIEESNTELVSVGTSETKKVNCVVIHNLTDRLLQSYDFPMTCNFLAGGKGVRLHEDSESAVKNGMRLGRMLGKKLKVRSEKKVTKYSRRRNGKIDGRMIASLGYDAENVFYKLDVDEYKQAFLHLTIDGSGSMSGNKWEKSMTCAVAIAKAASMIDNVHVVISFRIVHKNGLPCIVMAYNSKVDKISKINRVFPHLNVTGTTPEGLCFEAILDTIPSGTHESDSYFLNFSDGEPNFSCAGMYYAGREACQHTKKQVDKLKNQNVKVISYFISSRHIGQRSLDQFRTMYGRDAENIDITNITSVANTMNKKFLEKSK